MSDRDEDIIRKRAYALWEAEGHPDDRHAEHWEQASREVSGEASSDDQSKTDEAAVDLEDATHPAPLAIVKSDVANELPLKKRGKTT